jgi:hypothetical protein
MANKKKVAKAKPTNIKQETPELNIEKSLSIIAALASRLLEEGSWIKVVKKELAGQAELNPNPEVHG